MFSHENCFEIPEKEITINTDNVTLSPDQFTVIVPELIGSNMRIIYYCLLHYIFERHPEHKGVEMYQKLLHFIYTHDLTVKQKNIFIRDEEAKIYYTKFFYSLFREKGQRKLIV